MTGVYVLVRGWHRRWEGPSHSRHLVRYNPGDPIVLTDEEAARFGPRVQRVSGDQVELGGEVDPISQIGSLEVDAAVGLVLGAESAPGVQALRDAEEQGEAREEVLDAADERLLSFARDRRTAEDQEAGLLDEVEARLESMAVADIQELVDGVGDEETRRLVASHHRKRAKIDNLLRLMIERPDFAEFILGSLGIGGDDE